MRAKERKDKCIWDGALAGLVNVRKPIDKIDGLLVKVYGSLWTVYLLQDNLESKKNLYVTLSHKDSSFLEAILRRVCVRRSPTTLTCVGL